MRLVSPDGPEGGTGTTEVICGRCLCGEVAFELQASHLYGSAGAMGVCHCTHCQHWSGGSGLPFVVVLPERFRVTRGQEQLAHYRDESSVRAFCRRCGSNLYQDVGSAYYVGAGGLRDLDLTPGFHIHVAQKAPWDQIIGDAPQFAETPIAPHDMTVGGPSQPVLKVVHDGER